MRNLTPLLFLPLLAACPPSEGTDDFAGGNYSFSTIGADDQCNDGALEAIYQPDGQGVANPFGTSIYVPSTDELPYDGTLDLPDPFADISVQITGEGDSRTFSGGENTQVDLDVDTYPNCKVDFDIGADCTIGADDKVTCSATLTLSNATGDDCPTMSSNPCTITLDIEGTPEATM